MTDTWEADYVRNCRQKAVPWSHIANQIGRTVTYVRETYEHRVRAPEPVEVPRTTPRTTPRYMMGYERMFDQLAEAGGSYVTADELGMTTHQASTMGKNIRRKFGEGVIAAERGKGWRITLAGKMEHAKWVERESGDVA